ncbi:MAG: type II toxin-antitoxin system RelB/DinJ family antitoxin [Methylococcales bacterium]|nr:type II toxin-antitoxin system RelB/DinJ family antitoxin [Methylococcales bacterium]
MTTNVLIQTQIDDTVKKEAATVLATMGLTIPDAIRLMLIKVAREHKLPFDPLLPNAETIAAMEEARIGQLQSAQTIEQFMQVIQ